jgi:hypothetical protein
MREQAKIGGEYTVRIYGQPTCPWKRWCNRLMKRSGRSGRFAIRRFGLFRGPLKQTIVSENIIPSFAVEAILSCYFLNGTQYPAWYCGMIGSSVSERSTLLASDTAAHHPGWAEWLGYAESTRPRWNPTNNIFFSGIQNPPYMAYTMTEPFYLWGFFLISDYTKDGTAGLLVSEAGVNGAPVFIDDVDTTSLDVQYKFFIIPQPGAP